MKTRGEKVYARMRACHQATARAARNPGADAIPRSTPAKDGTINRAQRKAGTAMAPSPNSSRIGKDSVVPMSRNAWATRPGRGAAAEVKAARK